MKIVLQRVLNANVTVDEKIIGSINKGYVVFLGVAKGDTKEMVDKIVDKISKLRLFEDENEKINFSVQDVMGEILVISQFTLLADCKKGNRPSFFDAAGPDEATALYEYFLACCDGKFKKVEHGQFGADMKVSLVNDGPFTIVLEA